MDPPGGAGDGRHEVQVTPMVPIMLPVLGNLACRLLIKVLVRFAWVKQFSIPVPVPRRSPPPVVPHAEVQHKILSPLAEVARELDVSPLFPVDGGDRTLSLDLGPRRAKRVRKPFAGPVVGFGSPCMMFTCFCVIAVFVKKPTRAATARARLGSNDG